MGCGGSVGCGASVGIGNSVGTTGSVGSGVGDSVGSGPTEIVMVTIDPRSSDVPGGGACARTMPGDSSEDSCSITWISNPACAMSLRAWESETPES